MSAAQIEMPGARTRKFRGRIYVEVTAEQADAGDVVEYHAPSGCHGRLLARVARADETSVTLEPKRFAGVTLKGRGRRRIKRDHIIAAWRPRATRRP